MHSLPLPLPLFPLLLSLLPLQTSCYASSSSGTTTRYWDCCKPSCAWSNKATLAGGATAVQTCDNNNHALVDPNAQSGCNDGPAYMCANESPWAISDNLSYGYAAVHIADGSESSWCCACYELTFTSGSVSGKKMIIQATNTGGDLNSNQFDISIPGGGVGLFNGCAKQYQQSSPNTNWGAQYGGISSRADCDSFPTALQAGCRWRWDWFQGADNPAVTFRRVACPLAISQKTGCVRADEAGLPVADGAGAGAGGVGIAATTATTTTPAAGNTLAPPGPAQPQYAQCGGINWKGSTVCVAGTTCHYGNDWYSQCL